MNMMHISSKCCKYGAILRRLTPNVQIADPSFQIIREEFSNNIYGYILNLGSGKENLCTNGILVNLDIQKNECTSVVGDAHCLPFKDDVFAGIYSNQVFEHLQKPWVVSSEIYRVTNLYGKVLVMAPFMSPRHGSPADYFRYTDLGLISVLEPFKEIKTGVYRYPAANFIRIAARFTSGFFGNNYVRYGIFILIHWLLWPLKFLDFIYRKSKHRSELGNFFYYGEKR